MASRGLMDQVKPGNAEGKILHLNSTTFHYLNFAQSYVNVQHCVLKSFKGLYLNFWILDKGNKNGLKMPRQGGKETENQLEKAGLGRRTSCKTSRTR